MVLPFFKTLLQRSLKVSLFLFTDLFKAAFPIVKLGKCEMIICVPIRFCLANIIFDKDLHRLQMVFVSLNFHAISRLDLKLLLTYVKA